MAPPITLSIYIARQFAGAVVSMLLALSGLVALFDFIELLRRSISKPDATFTLVAEIAALRLPYIAMQVLPFAVLLGGMFCFWRLTRSSELVVARSAGVSAWQFLAAPTLCAMAFGVLATAALSPLSSVMFGRAESMDNLYLRSSGGPLALNGGQLWLRQSDHALSPQGVAIFHAHGVELHGKRLTAIAGQCVSPGRSRSIAHADRGRPGDARCRCVAAAGCADDPSGTDAGAAGHDQPADRSDRRPRAGELCVARYAVVLDAARLYRVARPVGFSSIRHRLHFQALLAQPLLCATMGLVAAGFSMRPTRRGGVAKMITSGVATGFALFLISKIAEEFGHTGALPVVLAAMGARSIGHDAGNRAAVAHGRRLRMARSLAFARRSLGPLVLLAMLLVLAWPRITQAQLGALTSAGSQPQPARDQPVTFTADSVTYDRDNSLVVADGHVEAWQNDHVLRADRITFDAEYRCGCSARQCRTAGAGRAGAVRRLCGIDTGHEERRAPRHAGDHGRNGRLAANGARRIDGQINELSRVVYSTCNLCAEDPTRHRCGSSAPCRRCRTWRTRRSNTRMRCWRCTASRSAICHISAP